MQRTIVPEPAGYNKVQWNEFPEEEQKVGWHDGNIDGPNDHFHSAQEQQSVPRVTAKEWVPENEVEHPVLKNVYQPGRIAPNPESGRLWPPPGYGEEEQIELGLEKGKMGREKGGRFS